MSKVGISERFLKMEDFISHIIDIMGCEKDDIKLTEIHEAEFDKLYKIKVVVNDILKLSGDVEAIVNPFFNDYFYKIVKHQFHSDPIDIVKKK